MNARSFARTIRLIEEHEAALAEARTTLEAVHLRQRLKGLRYLRGLGFGDEDKAVSGPHFGSRQ